MELTALILAGGLGTRLRQVVNDVPKALAPIDGEPFLILLLRMLAAKGFTHAVLATGYMGDKIHDVVGSCVAGIEIKFSHEIEPLGTGGAMKKALAECGGNRVFVLNGDTWLDVDYSGMASEISPSVELAIMGISVPDVSRYGKLKIRNNLVCAIEEKSASGSGFINAGCYLVSKHIFSSRCMPTRFSFESDFLPSYLQKHGARFYACEGDFFDIGIPATYKNFKEYHKKKSITKGVLRN